MQSTAGIRKHAEAVKLFARRVLACLETTVGFPECLGLGLNFLVPSGPVAGVRLSVEGIVPLVQDLDGPQLERDYAVVVGLRKAF